MDVYKRVRELMAERLSTRTGWGRNQVLETLDFVLLQVAAEEIQQLKNERDYHEQRE